MIEALREFHRYYGSSLTVELPRWSRTRATLDEAAAEIAGRLTQIFLRDSDRPPSGPGWPGAIPVRPPLARPCSCSMSTSTATTARASGPATRPAGRALVAELIDWRQAMVRLRG